MTPKRPAVRLESVYNRLAEGQTPDFPVSEVAVTDPDGIATFQDGRTIWLNDANGDRVLDSGVRITRTFIIRGAR